MTVAQEIDFIAKYCLQIGFVVRPRTVLVEGTSDVDLFRLAAELELAETGVNLLGPDFAIVAAGEGDRGGTYGVVRELISLRGMATQVLLPNSRPRYRFIGLFDNDSHGKSAIDNARRLDIGIVEYRDVFRLRPVMPITANLHPPFVGKAFDSANRQYGDMKWELEDMLPATLADECFADHPGLVSRCDPMADVIHRELTQDGKAKLHHFTKTHAIRSDLGNFVKVIRSLRAYAGLQPLLQA